MTYIIVCLGFVIVGFLSGIEVVVHLKTFRAPVEMRDGETLTLDYPD